MIVRRKAFGPRKEKLRLIKSITVAGIESRIDEGKGETVATPKLGLRLTDPKLTEQTGPAA